jgi:hypothetical protein
MNIEEQDLPIWPSQQAVRRNIGGSPNDANQLPPTFGGVTRIGLTILIWHRLTSPGFAKSIDGVLRIEHEFFSREE